MDKITAIVLAGGRGKRMNSDIPKQYLPVNGRPLLYYTLKAFQDSRVTDITLVTTDEDKQFCQKEIVEKYNISKVSEYAIGGKERYHSVYNGIMASKGSKMVLIHDGARPFISKEIINGNIDALAEHPACVTGMPSKDTVKIVDDNGFVKSTPNRKSVWNVQTPQSFEYNLIKKAYAELINNEQEVINKGITITDDAMVVELMTNETVKLIEGSYLNIKITTPEDMLTAQMILKP